MKKFLFIIVFVSQFGFTQNYTEYLTGNATDLDIAPNRGVCLMGGATESDDAMQWFLSKANGGDVVVLRASGSDGYNNYFYSELGVTINSVRTFVINNVSGAVDPYVLDKVEKAEAIWFAGGDQYNYVSYFKNNAMEAALNAFVNTKQGVIGGTSAGMAILGSAYFDAENGTVTNAQALANPYHERVSLGYNDFLSIPFLDHVITDTHYDDPDRRARHSVFLARYTQDNSQRAFGIACNEYTAVCIEPDGKAYVFGDYPNYEEHAFFIQANCVSDFSPETCTSGTPLNWVRNNEALKVYKVPGMTTGENYFDLSDWQSGSGGIWQNWYVDNGVFQTTAGVNPNCDTSGVEVFQKTGISVYPNPFKNEIQININLKAYTVSLYDVFGRELETQQNASRIETNSLPTGIYFISVTSETSVQTFKIIKE